MFRKKIKAVFYTPNKNAFDLFKPETAAKATPSWFGKADNNGFDINVQNCRGMREFFRHGVSIPLWSDLRLKSTDDRIEWEFSDKTSELQVENNFGVMQRDKHALCKLIVPWAVECTEPVHFMQVQNMWEPSASAFRSINGTMEFKYQHAINLFLYIPPNTDTIASAGTRFFMLVPLSERQLEIDVKYDPEKYSALRFSGERRAFFKNWYVKQRNIKEGRQ